MEFPQCRWPAWRKDDFTHCFQQEYLRVIFPVVVALLSFAHLGITGIRRIILSRQAGYQEIPSAGQANLAAQRTGIPPSEAETLDEDYEDNGLEIAGGRLALSRTTTKGSIVQADAPPAQNLSVAFEVLMISGLIAVNAVALATNSFGDSSGGRIAAISGVAVWLYVLVLAGLRLSLGTVIRWNIPRLWNHTAIIYGLQWVFETALLWSAILHPISKSSQSLIIVEFVLASLLFGTAVTTRAGNRTVLLEWEDDVEPSREPLASLISMMTFSWIFPMLWKARQQGKLDLKDVWNLLPQHKAVAVLSNYRKMKQTTSLSIHLFKYFKGSFSVQFLYALGAGLFTFAPALLLKAIVEYVEDPSSGSLSVVWLYVILLPITVTLKSICEGMALWIGRQIGIQLRAVLIGEIYAKTLRRKVTVVKEKALLQEDKKANAEDPPKESIIEKLKRFVRLKKSSKPAAEPAQQDSSNGTEGSEATEDEQVNVGTVINLMSVDSFNVSDITAYLYKLLVGIPVQIFLAIGLLVTMIGWSCIPGIVVMLLFMPVNVLIAKGYMTAAIKIIEAKDKRINVTNEILQNIRLVKYFAWEERFKTLTNETRVVELRAIRRQYMVGILAHGFFSSVPILVALASFFSYTVIEGKPLYPSVAFMTTTLFSLLSEPLLQIGFFLAAVQRSAVSIKRVQKFLEEKETSKYEQLGPDNIDDTGREIIGFKAATFSWGGKDDNSKAFRLIDLNVEFEFGKLNLITGPTGSGKTSLLMALLGEMTLLDGKVYLPGGRSRDDVRPDPETGLANNIAYVAQSPWLLNANIKENILFAATFDEQRYKDVIVACALERDLEILDQGDETLIGEKGIALSGGQKQRISLARAVYSNSQHLLLDDCLSAVDAHTSQWIFSNCIKGPLMTNRTCILVSHNIQLCAPSSDFVVVMDNGRISAQGPAQDIISSGKFGEDIQATKSRPGSAVVSRVPSRVPSSVGGGEVPGATAATSTGAINGDNTKKERAKKDAMEESKFEGAVSWSVIKVYLSALGSWRFCIVMGLLFLGPQLADSAFRLWIREWTNQYTTEEYSNPPSSPLLRSGEGFLLLNSHPLQPALGKAWSQLAGESSSDSGSNVNVGYYIGVLAAIGLAETLLGMLQNVWEAYGALTASRKIFDRLLDSIYRASFQFFDATPLGQIMNRFSKDLEAIDQEVANSTGVVIYHIISISISIILISYLTPAFVVAGVLLSTLYFIIASVYIRASRDLKRLDSVTKSPLFQQFGETLSGIITIRAYGDERRFIRGNLDKINTQSRPFIYLWAANRWLAFRAEIMGGMVSFFAGAFALVRLSYSGIDAGAVGLMLTYAITFSDQLLWTIRYFAEFEQNMNSVERVKEYLDVEQEAAPITDYRPPKNWPISGSVDFTNYSTRYRKDLDLVLKKINLRIEPNEKVGVVGRTGAGKSSLALALFRVLEAEADGGKIEIDGIDISLMGLQDLRQAITMVPQDPTLFSGTIRSNLDPFDVYTDVEIFEVLRKVQLIGSEDPQDGHHNGSSVAATAIMPELPTIEIMEERTESQAPDSEETPSPEVNKNVFLDLSSQVTESGSNLSQGQRQLLCLARAMLKKSNVLVMDEATASIDYATDFKIQSTIRALTATTITIAHRLRTIADYDKVVVLDKGEVVEYGHPFELMKKQDGVFRGLCETSDEYDLLFDVAKKAYGNGLLVDVNEETTD